MKWEELWVSLFYTEFNRIRQKRHFPDFGPFKNCWNAFIEFFGTYIFAMVWWVYYSGILAHVKWQVPSNSPKSFFLLRNQSLSKNFITKASYLFNSRIKSHDKICKIVDTNDAHIGAPAPIPSGISFFPKLKMFPSHAPFWDPGFHPAAIYLFLWPLSSEFIIQLQMNLPQR